MSECEKKLEPAIYKLGLITDETPPNIKAEADCTDYYKARGDDFKDLDMCKKQINKAREKYKFLVNTYCTKKIPGGMRKRRKSRRTKRKRKTLNKNKRTKRKRKTLKKSRRTRRH